MGQSENMHYACILRDRSIPISSGNPSKIIALDYFSTAYVNSKKPAGFKFKLKTVSRIQVHIID